jgi:hypothetical protein
MTADIEAERTPGRSIGSGLLQNETPPGLRQ